MYCEYVNSRASTIESRGTHFKIFKMYIYKFRNWLKVFKQFRSLQTYFVVDVFSIMFYDLR